MKARRRFALLLFACLPALAADEFLWHDPGRVERLDLAGGPAGRAGYPLAPFTFVREDLSGSSAKIFVRDSRGRLWNVKFGVEVRGESFSARIPWAMGYFAEANYFVARGYVLGMRKLSRRAARYVTSGGTFADARFQLRDPNLRFLKDHDWSWSYNPFVNTPQLAGLKILLMLTSNWDSKDARDVDEGSNTGIFEQAENRHPRYIYAFTDWGQTMGHWGGALRRTEWNCRHFAEDTPEFVRGVNKNGIVEFGWSGRHRSEFSRDVRVEDVRWLMQYLGRLRDSQIRAALNASGATREETECFARQLRRRIEMLRAVAGAGSG